MPIAALLSRIRSIIPGRHDRHYDEIVRGFGNGALRAPATPMSDSELARAIADFLKDSAVGRDRQQLGPALRSVVAALSEAGNLFAKDFTGPRNPGAGSSRLSEKLPWRIRFSAA